MKSALATLLILLAAAGLVLFGGTRLAQRESEEHIAANRELLLDFSAAMSDELDRLEELYLGHLLEVADLFLTGKDPAREKAGQVTGIETAHLFITPFPASPLVTPHKEEFIVNRLDHYPSNLPEVELEGGRHPLNPDHTVLLPRALIDDDKSGSHGWIDAPGGGYRLFWTRPEPTGLVVLVLDVTALRQTIDDHLGEWIELAMTPLRETGELVLVQGATGKPLAPASSETPRRGPAALMLPIRNSLGEWSIQAWYRVAVTTHRDPATLAVSATVAAVLAMAGIFLFVHQRRAVRLAERRVSFVNRVSHELGTPLTNIALNIDLANESLDPGSADASRRLAIASEEIGRLCRLAANVLTFSRRERRALALHPQPCVPDTVIGGVLDSFRPALTRRGITVELQSDAGERVRLDPDALSQVVGNLLSNVEKYAASGRWMRISSELAAGSLVVRVEDRGPGVPGAARQLIFHPFKRAGQAVDEGSSGTGLGLAIARELADRMDGSLRLLESATGATFELRVPAPPVLSVLADENHSAA